MLAAAHTLAPELAAKLSLFWADRQFSDPTNPNE
jgi:hypothetical protein